MENSVQVLFPMKQKLNQLISLNAKVIQWLCQKDSFIATVGFNQFVPLNFLIF